jgi:type I restriction enzyme R subunit
VREEFGKGNDFCKKITYKVTGISSDDLIAEFRNSYNPRIAVTVDMISTGTDIRPLEALVFMRAVKSRLLFEQMLGRGTRVVKPTELQAVTPDARLKSRFVIVDAVGVVEQEHVETGTLERKRSIPFKQLLEAVAVGQRDDDTLSSLAGRLARLEARLTEAERAEVTASAGGQSLRALVHSLLDAIDPDCRGEVTSPSAAGGETQGGETQPLRNEWIERAIAPFDSPQLRKTLIEIHERFEQVIDRVSMDRVTEARYDQTATERARATVASFRDFIEQHRDEITALQIIYSRPYGQQRLTYETVKELAERLQQPPQSWTTESLWWAYQQVEQDRVRGIAAPRVLTDVVALVRHALALDDELAPYPARVWKRYEDWLAAQEAAGRPFTEGQRWWLDRIAQHIGVSLAIAPADLDGGEFFARGGRVGARRALGASWPALLEELNTALVV